MESGSESQARQPEHGRHRRSSAGTVALPDPAPPGVRRSAHARPVIPVQPGPEDPLGPSFPGDALTEPLLPVRDPLVDTDPVGLRKFDIGTVPASVTPPRTWKKAAWFSVGSSAAVLIGLLVVAAFMVGPSRLRTQIESFPGQAWQVPLPTTTASTPRHGLPGEPSSVAARTDTTGNGTRPGAGPSAVISTGGASHLPTAVPTGTFTPPITTVSNPAGPVVDPTKIAQQTQHFFAAINNNVTEAYGLTSGALKADGEAALQKRYADAASVQLKGITVDPGKALTINTVLITKKDGSTVTEQHVLKFSADDLPLITDDRTK